MLDLAMLHREFILASTVRHILHVLLEIASFARLAIAREMLSSICLAFVPIAAYLDTHLDAWWVGNAECRSS